MTDNGTPQNPAPGYYYAAGDPAGTVRQWDGTQWVGDPMPAPPGAGGMVESDKNFAGLAVRLGAAVIDFVIVIGISFAGLLLFGDVDTSDNGFSATGGAEQILIALVLMVFLTWMIAVKGATPGKLILGLTITTEDGETTPPGARKAILRSLPYLIGNIPVLGFFVVVGALIASIFMISSDPENRSAFDRIGDTRVIAK